MIQARIVSQEEVMLRALLFIVVVYIVVNTVFPGFGPISVSIDGQPIGGFSGGILAMVITAVAGLALLGLLVAVIAGTVVMSIGLPLLLIALVLCAIFAPILVPFIIIAAIGMALLCALGGLFA